MAAVVTGVGELLAVDGGATAGGICMRIELERERSRVPPGCDGVDVRYHCPLKFE